MLKKDFCSSRFKQRKLRRIANGLTTAPNIRPGNELMAFVDKLALDIKLNLFEKH